MRRPHAAILAVLGLLCFACAKRSVVEVPPRVDLREFETIGIVEFESTAKGNLGAYSTQRFVEALTESQPGVRVLELGKASELEGAADGGRIDHGAARKIGEKYHVDALVIGQLLVKDVRPRVDITQMVKTMSVSADVDAALTARLLDTKQGATVWTRVTDASRTVAQVGVNGKAWRFDAQEPDKAYGELVNTLVNDITYDFRPSYVRE
jgi:hypothetical protein